MSKTCNKSVKNGQKVQLKTHLCIFMNMEKTHWWTLNNFEKHFICGMRRHLKKNLSFNKQLNIFPKISHLFVTRNESFMKKHQEFLLSQRQKWVISFIIDCDLLVTMPTNSIWPKREQQATYNYTSQCVLAWQFININQDSNMTLIKIVKTKVWFPVVLFCTGIYIFIQWLSVYLLLRNYSHLILEYKLSGFTNQIELCCQAVSDINSSKKLHSITRWTT